MAMVYLDGATRAFKWNVAHIIPQQSSHPIQRCSSCHMAAGVILIRCATTFPRVAGRKVFPVPFCTHQLQNFQNFDKTKNFLYEILQNLPLLGYCKNVVECARILARDLASQFHFTPASFNWGTERHALVLYINLTVDTGNMSENHDFSRVLELENAKQIEHYLTTSEECPEIWANGSKGMEEVKAFYEITEVDIDQDKKKNEACPICLEGLHDHKSSKDDVVDDVVRACCSHMFHAKCVGTWLVRNRSCPMCRSSFDISVQRLKSWESPTIH